MSVRKVAGSTNWILENNNESPSEQVTSCIPYNYKNFHISVLPPYMDTIYLESARLGYALGPVYFTRENLRKLVLSNNQFYSFIGPICNATTLQQLDLSGNRATDISYYVFSWLPNLLNLSLADNFLGTSYIFQKNTSKSIFKSQSNLLDLNVSANRFSTLHPNIFWNLLSAKEIFLDHNLLNDWKVEISPYLILAGMKSCTYPQQEWRFWNHRLAVILL